MTRYFALIWAVAALKPYFQRSLVIISLAVLFSSITAQAAILRDDYDLDDNGLIEIASIEDFLAISDFDTGDTHISRYSNTAGCPEERCQGYELVGDIDFGAFSSATHDYQGPVLYDSVFEGNHHAIRNLSATSFSGVNGGGLFGHISESTLQNFSVDNINFDQTPTTYLGGLAALIHSSVIQNVRVSGHLTNDHYTGGLAGVMSHSVVINSGFEGIITPTVVGSGFYKGGLVGAADGVTVYASSAKVEFAWSGALMPSNEFGALLGWAYGRSQIVASYGNMDFLGADNKIGNLSASPASIVIESSYATTRIPIQNSNDAYVVAYYSSNDYQVEQGTNQVKTSVKNLKCPQDDFDDNCDLPDLLTGWHTHLDTNGEPVWQFNSDDQLPTINSNFDYDGADSDGDLIPDILDRFVNHATVAADFDRDGLPDYWNPSCDADCQANAGLSLDDDVEYPHVVTSTNNGTAEAGGVLLRHLAGALALLLIYSRLHRHRCYRH